MLTPVDSAPLERKLGPTQRQAVERSVSRLAASGFQRSVRENRMSEADTEFSSKLAIAHYAVQILAPANEFSHRRTAAEILRDMTAHNTGKKAESANGSKMVKT